MTESGRRPSFWVTLPGLITALATLLTAVVGAYVLLRGTGDPTSPSAETADTRASAPASAPTAPGTPVPAWEDGEGQVVMNPGTYVDLDAGTWGTGPSGDAELYWDAEAGTLTTLSAASALIEGHPTANFIITCQGMVEDVRGGAMTVADLLPGDPLCVRTDHGATGSLEVDTVDLAGTPPEITISAFVR